MTEIAIRTYNFYTREINMRGIFCTQKLKSQFLQQITHIFDLMINV